MQPEALIRRLADGQPRSGETLARELGVTRAAIWKQVRKLQHLGLAVEAERGSGYRLTRPIDMLEPGSIARHWRAGREPPLGRFEVFAVLPSTNRHLLDGPAPRPGQLDVCIAEFQTAGRGRRGRPWTAPFGAALCLSAGWQFAETPPDLAALTLAVGVAARRALGRTAAVEPVLKWPNDLVWDERKLGGILVELKAEAQARCHAVAGIGINVTMPPEQLSAISDWPRGAVDLAAATRGAAPYRAALAAALIEELAGGFDAFARHGFAPFAAAWREADYLAGRRVRVETADGCRDGVARGIDADGALRVEGPDGALRRILSGDISVRVAP